MQRQNWSRFVAWAPSVFYGLLYLVFLQLMTEFVGAIYAFGLLGTSIPPEIAAVGLFFAPILWFILPRRWAATLRWPLGLLVILSRIIAELLDTRGRMLAAGVGVSAFLLLFPALIYVESRRAKDAFRVLGTGLPVTLVLAVLLRSWHSGVDLSTRGATQIVGWGIVLLLVALAFRVWGSTKDGSNNTAGNNEKRRVTLPVLGAFSVWVLLYFAFGSPNVIARWTDTSYLWVTAFLMLAFSIYLAVTMFKPDWLADLSSRTLWAWNGIFVTALALTLYRMQLGFPLDPAAYPLDGTPRFSWGWLPLLLMLLSSPVMLLDFHLYLKRLHAARPSLWELGGAFSLGSLYLVVMIFSNVFTTVYDYIPVIGPAFRNQFWLVYLAAGVVLLLPFLFSAAGSTEEEDLHISPGLGGLQIILAVLAVLGIAITRANPAPGDTTSKELRVLTYNIQQGYSDAGQRNYDGQLALIASLAPDVVGLQESDTNRIAGGNDDVVRYFADRLNMFAYYGPNTVVGTFGIALLSRYPLENQHTFYMYSEGEQTATISAHITLGGKTFNLFVTHLGNGGPIIQQEAILSRVTGKENVILMGDFNFRPDSDPYRLTLDSLEDAWYLRWPDGADDQGFFPEGRIDHFFVSPGTRVTDARYLNSSQSDHPAGFITLEW